MQEIYRIKRRTKSWQQSWLGLVPLYNRWVVEEYVGNICAGMCCTAERDCSLIGSFSLYTATDLGQRFRLSHSLDKRPELWLTFVLHQTQGFPNPLGRVCQGHSTDIFQGLSDLYAFMGLWAAPSAPSQRLSGSTAVEASSLCLASSERQ
jgi:hypothetical protein